MKPNGASWKEPTNKAVSGEGLHGAPHTHDPMMALGFQGPNCETKLGDRKRYVLLPGMRFEK